MVTTIQVDEKTKEQLFELASKLERTMGRRVTYDEAIRALLSEVQKTRSARYRFRKQYGALGPDPKAWQELTKLRRSEKARLERIGGAPH